MPKKSNKISFKNAKIVEQNGTFTIKVKPEDGEEITENLNKRLEEFINIDGIDINVKKGRKSSGVGRLPQFKYICNCGIEIKSKEDNLEIKCLKCDSDFKISDK